MAYSDSEQSLLLKIVGLQIVFIFLFLFVIVSKNILTHRKFRNVEVISDVKSQARIVNSPIRLVIPSINVDVKIVMVGVNSRGEMETPSDSADAGWFQMGPAPGEEGSAVIDGHFDTKTGDEAVFFNLYKLKKGDRVEVKNSEGNSYIFIVRDSHIYDPGYVEEVFNQVNGVHLNLITCDGVWDGITKSFTNRLVVYTDLSQ